MEMLEYRKSLWVAIRRSGKNINECSIHDTKEEAEDAAAKLDLVERRREYLSPLTYINAFEVKGENIFIEKACMEKRNGIPLPMNTPLDQMGIEDMEREIKYRELRNELRRVRKNDGSWETEKEKEAEILRHGMEPMYKTAKRRPALNKGRPALDEILGTDTHDT